MSAHRPRPANSTRLTIVTSSSACSTDPSTLPPLVTFFKHGKTDMLLVVPGGGSSYVECKIWRGGATVSEAEAQILGYLTWRDSYGVILIFSRTERFSAVRQFQTPCSQHHRCEARWCSRSLTTGGRATNSPTMPCRRNSLLGVPGRLTPHLQLRRAVNTAGDLAHELPTSTIVGSRIGHAWLPVRARTGPLR